LIIFSKRCFSSGPPIPVEIDRLDGAGDRRVYIRISAASWRRLIAPLLFTRNAVVVTVHFHTRAILKEKLGLSTGRHLGTINSATKAFWVADIGEELSPKSRYPFFVGYNPGGSIYHGSLLHDHIHTFLENNLFGIT